MGHVKSPNRGTVEHELRLLRPSVLLAVAILLTAGCGSFIGSLPVLGGPASLVDRAVLAADGRSVDIVVIGSAPMAEGKPCGADFGITSGIAGNELQVTVRYTAIRQGDCMLTEQVCCEHHLSVDLPEGSAVDTLRDLGGIAGRTLFLKRPAGLFEIHGLPAGWKLQREWAEWNGSWMRIYSPTADPPTRETDTLIFGTTFGGKIVTEAEALQPPVKVNGRNAQYQRYPSIDQIQLQWMVDDQRLWLEAFEPHFAIQDLVTLADGATR